MIDSISCTYSSVRLPAQKAIVTNFYVIDFQ